MQLALECPTCLLKDIQPLADFSWVLTHLVLKDKEYADFYRHREGKFLVLDNSVNELLEPCSLRDMEEAAQIVRPDLIVPPDFLGDNTGTSNSLMEALKIWPLERILPVIQGSDLGDAVECARRVLSLGFDRVAVPYDITCSRLVPIEEMARARLKVVNSITTVVPMGFQIHLLGMTTLEELEAHNRGWVKSVDTGVPIKHGLWGSKFGEDKLGNKKKPTLSLMNPYTGEDPDVWNEKMISVYYNIAFLRKVIQEES